MSSFDLTQLNQAFAIPGQLSFQQHPSGLVVAEIDNAHARAGVFLQGAQLTRWTPHRQVPVIWLSPAAKFAEGKAIRGGIPVCWPWFGAHDTEPELPAHGYARTSVWEVVKAATGEDGATCLVLRLLAKRPSLWPHETPLEIRLVVGQTLAIELVTRNLGTEPVLVRQALHTYFQVADVRQVEIHGLDGYPYLDKLDGVRKQQAGAVVFSGELDRVYLDQGGYCLIDDPGLQRHIRIAKRGSHSTIVWNPWSEKAAKLGDMGEDGHLGMVCVESANADEDVVRLEPGAEHGLRVEYSVEDHH